MREKLPILAASLVAACKDLSPKPYPPTETTLYHEAFEDTATPVQAGIAERVEEITCGPFTLSRVAHETSEPWLIVASEGYLETSGVRTGTNYCSHRLAGDGGVFDTYARPCHFELEGGETLYVSGPTGTMLSFFGEASLHPESRAMTVAYGSQTIAGIDRSPELLSISSAFCEAWMRDYGPPSP